MAIESTIIPPPADDEEVAEQAPVPNMRPMCGVKFLRDYIKQGVRDGRISPETKARLYELFQLHPRPRKKRKTES